MFHQPKGAAPSGATAAKPSYLRKDVRRLLRITEAQLRGWEAQKLVTAHAEYGFRDLVALRTLLQLRKDRIPLQQIKRAIHALRRQLKDGNPLTELKLFADGKRIRVEMDGRKMEAESGQLILDFSHGELTKLLEFKAKEPAQTKRDTRREAEHWFEKGLQLEQKGAPAEEIIEAYKNAIELDPRTAGAHVNLGTLYFNARHWSEAEQHYKTAIELDPNYALAHFDLGNLYDERNQRELAREHYLRAIRLVPGYADAHYNLALLHQGAGESMKAVHHWTLYLKLDPASEWSSIARRELGKLRKAALVGGLRSGV